MITEKNITIISSSSLSLQQIKEQVEKRLTVRHLCYVVANPGTDSPHSILLILRCLSQQAEEIFASIQKLVDTLNLRAYVQAVIHERQITTCKEEVRQFYARQTSVDVPLKA